VLADLRALHDNDDVMLSDMDHAYIQTVVRLGRIPDTDRRHAEALVEKYKEDV
jgi:hypothetical protein